MSSIAVTTDPVRLSTNLLVTSFTTIFAKYALYTLGKDVRVPYRLTQFASVVSSLKLIRILDYRVSLPQ